MSAAINSWVCRAATLAALLACPWSQAAPIYTCVDGNGKRLTSDRPILDCIDREQRVLNSDGSVRTIVPRTLTAEERADKEAREREAASQRANRQDAVRRDRNLLARFPDRAAHDRAREAALDNIRSAMKASEGRMATLVTERKPLMDETEFYIGKTLPLKLKRQIDANDAANEAQRNLIRDQEGEMARINANFDAELVQLKHLWGGALPGSINPAAAAPAPSAPRKSAAN